MIMAMNKTLTIRQMARIAGVSVATISRVTNPETRSMVAPDTCARIDALIAQHGYVPNMTARNLSTPRTRTIGVVVPYVHNIFFSAYYSNIMAGVANALIDTDYQFKVILLKPDVSLRAHYDFRGEGIEGLVMTQWFRFFKDKSVFEGMGIPCIHINDHDPQVPLKFICEDSLMGGGLVAEHLRANGHRRVGVVTGASWSRDSLRRLAGFRRVWEEKGLTLPDELIAEGDFDEVPLTEAAAQRLLDKGVTAIFSCNDTMAFMIIRYLQAKGLRCPDDISVVGYDDDFRCADFSPPVTTVRVSVYQVAVEAVSDLVTHIREHGRTPMSGEKWVPVELVSRGSVKNITV